MSTREARRGRHFTVYMIESTKLLTIGVCDTQPVTAEGVKAAISACADLKFIAAAKALSPGLDLAISQAPDLLLIDKAFGMQAVVDFISKLHELRSQCAPVVWGTSITEPEALRFLQNGAKGILRKTADVDKLIACLRAVGTGTTWMEDSVFREAPRADIYPRSELTPREQQVMELVEHGLKNKEIARELNIRPGTVKIHLKHIFEKTGVRGRYGLALSGLKHRGVISMLTV